MQQEIVNKVIESIASILESKNIPYEYIDNNGKRESIKWSSTYYVSPCDEDGDLISAEKSTHFLFDDYDSDRSEMFAIDDIEALYTMIAVMEW